LFKKIDTEDGNEEGEDSDEEDEFKEAEWDDVDNGEGDI
jgi:hypothetical protein